MSRKLPVIEPLPIRSYEAWINYECSGWKAQIAFAGRSFAAIGKPTAASTTSSVPAAIGLAYNGWAAPSASYHRLDASATKAFILGKGVLLAYLHLNNLPDRGNVSHYSFGQDGREREENFGRRLFWCIVGRRVRM